ncbi:hypothetical protein [Streptomyces brasiliensis]|nr:hypothetical protein [Streptomyces brasiliensis]
MTLQHTVHDLAVPGIGIDRCTGSLEHALARGAVGADGVLCGKPHRGAL